MGRSTKRRLYDVLDCSVIECHDVDVGKLGRGVACLCQICDLGHSGELYGVPGEKLRFRAVSFLSMQIKGTVIAP